MMKRGQIAIFTILALVLVGVIVFFYLSLSKQTSIGKLPESDKVHNIVKRHLENTLYLCIEKIGKQGGYNFVPYNLLVNTTAYWYKNRVVIQPLLEDIESEISKCSEDLLKNTIDKVYNYFINNSIKISNNRIKVDTYIKDDIILAQVFYPITIIGEQSTATINDFSVTFGIRLKDLYDQATVLLNNVILPDFDLCNPQKYVESDLNFIFLTDGENLIVKGQEVIIFENGTRKSYELIFAIQRHINEAFGPSKKRLVVLYQDNADLPTFGGKALEILNQEAELTGKFDSYNCGGISQFIQNIENYDVVIITGVLQYQIVRVSGSDILLSNEEGQLLYGCNEFNKEKRKQALKNWVNSGGVLWINDVNKHESDDFIVSYLGFLGYQGGQWEPIPLSPLSGIKSFLVEKIKERKVVISTNEINNHIILQCPYNISKDIADTWFDRSLQVTSQDDVIVGNKNEAKLWIRNIGRGFVVFDEFLLKDNLYEQTLFNDDLFSKGLADKYFVNVLTYLAKHKKEADRFLINLLYPIKNEIIKMPYFKFASNLENVSYSMQLVDISGKTFDVTLTNDLLKENDTIKKINLSVLYYSDWDNLSDGFYEWRIFGKKEGIVYSSDIGFFTKNISFNNSSLF